MSQRHAHIPTPEPPQTPDTDPPPQPDIPPPPAPDETPPIGDPTTKRNRPVKDPPPDEKPNPKRY